MKHMLIALTAALLVGCNDQNGGDPATPENAVAPSVAAWAEQSSGTGDVLRSVAFADANTGFAVGLQGTVLRTLDGGSTWSEYWNAFGRSLYGVAFFNPGTLAIVGGTGWIVGLDTTWPDVGLSSVDTLDAIRAVSCPSPNGWFAVSQTGEIIKTYVTVTYAERPLFSISFADASTGVAVGEGGFAIATTDGGATWTIGSTGTNATLYGVRLNPTLHGWAVGADGTILATSDGGATWKIQASGTEATLNGVDSVDDSTAWAVGAGGTLLKTKDGGASWKPLSSGMTDPLFAVDFVDANRGWVVGGFGRILATTTGGE